MNSYKSYDEFTEHEQKIIKEDMKYLTKSTWIDDEFLRTHLYLFGLGMIIDMKKIKEDK